MGVVDGYNVVFPRNDKFEFNELPKYQYDFDSKQVQFLSWSKEDATHRWNVGKKSKILFDISTSQMLRGKMELVFGASEKQSFRVYLNGVHVGDVNDVQGWYIRAEIHFKRKLIKKGKNILDLHFVSHNNTDVDRNIALRFFAVE